MHLFPINGPAGPLSGLSTPGTDENATPLVLLHGIQGSARSWSGVLEHLPRHIPVVVPNLRGRSESVAPEDPAAYALDDMAADLAAVLGALDRPTVLVGWSMGVLVSLAYIQRYGEPLVRALALVSGTAQGNACRWFEGETAEKIAEEAEHRARNLGLVESATPTATAGSWLSVRDTDYRAVLPNIEVPTLVVHGSADDQCPLDHGRLIAEQVPGAELAVYEGGVHNLLAQDPSWLAERLAVLYASVQPPS